MWEFVDKFIYINLDHRQDRRDIMSKFFEEGQIPLEKVVRFSAIKRSHGPLGCVESHKEVLKLAKKENWKNILILEDDLEWLNFKDEYPKLEELTKLSDWNVILLLGWYWKYDFPRIYFSNNSGAYLVNESYRDKLLKNREISVHKLRNGIGFDYRNSKYNSDVYWCELMKKDVWYGLNPCICRQVDGFSDNGKTMLKSSLIYGIGDAKTRKIVYNK
uniref:Glycosyl transferase family 25 domain-containing protein n=1 Tax=viral metagenome TaxID=1070528 RepID=A0A6C0EQ29_9ZZZZ